MFKGLISASVMTQLNFTGVITQLIIAGVMTQLISAGIITQLKWRVVCNGIRDYPKKIFLETSKPQRLKLVHTTRYRFSRSIKYRPQWGEALKTLKDSLKCNIKSPCNQKSRESGHYIVPLSHTLL